jgi:hypothetical protein
MATPRDLMGLGMSPFLARQVGMDVIFVTAAGSTLASAKQLPGPDNIFVISGTNTGACLALPLVGGDGPANGALLGDFVTISNLCGSTITIYANSNGLGSVVTFYGGGVSVSGATGVSAPTGTQMYFQPITVSSWIFSRGSA